MVRIRTHATHLLEPVDDIGGEDGRQADPSVLAQLGEIVARKPLWPVHRRERHRRSVDLRGALVKLETGERMTKAAIDSIPDRCIVNMALHREPTVGHTHPGAVGRLQQGMVPNRRGDLHPARRACTWCLEAR